MLQVRRQADACQRVIGLVVVTAVALAACASEPVGDADPQTYRAAVNAICTTTRANEAEFLADRGPEPVGAFARDVAALLTSEAESLRAVTPPNASAADHRALIQNTDEQARRWMALAATPPEDTAAFGAIQTEILQLTLGRDDLAAEMALEACRRAPP